MEIRLLHQNILLRDANDCSNLYVGLAQRQVVNSESINVMFLLAGHPPTMPPPTMPFGAVPGGMNPFARGAQPSHHMRFPLQPSYQPQ